MVVEGENLMSWVMLPHMLAAKPWVSHVTFLCLGFLIRKTNKQTGGGVGRRRKRNYNLYLAKVLGDRIFESVGYSIKDLGAPQICFSYPRGVGTCSTLPPAGPSNLTTCTRALPR